MNEFKAITDYEDKWTALQGTLDGKPVFTRCKESLTDAVGHPKYPFQIGIATPLHNPTSDGLTTDAEADELWKIEDELTKTLEENQEAVHALTITYNGMREFVFYNRRGKIDSVLR